MIKLAPNMSEFWRIACKNIILTLYICWFYYMKCLLMHRHEWHKVFQILERQHVRYIRNTCAVIHPVRLCSDPQSSNTAFVISERILWHGYISMGGHISPEAEKVNTAVMDTSAGPQSTSYTFLSPLYAKPFPVFGYSSKPDASPLKILLLSWWISEEFLLRHLQHAEI